MIPALTAGGRPSDKTDEHGRSTLHFVALIVFYLLYLLLGAAVFSAIEQPYEQKLRQDLRLIKDTFLKEHLCLDPNNLEVFLKSVMDANSFGVSVLHNASGNVNWDFFSSLFFTSTVLSTTGYGHTVPLSQGGKLACIIYCSLGIPLTLMLLTAFLHRIFHLANVRPINYLTNRFGRERRNVAMVHASVVCLAVVICFFFIPAAIFTTMENWNYLEAFYFCFISLSTIGLGDFVPGEAVGQNYRELYKFAVTCYLLIGLLAMLLLLETVSELDVVQTCSRFFYPSTKAEFPEDEMAIMDKEQLPVSTISNQKPSSYDSIEPARDNVQVQ
uniref:Potassium channel subfamily K member n=1 Tax=Eptatretus burgeri TaxID=7764 RepID=A0A8C4NGC1_EPTBU